MAQLGQVIGGGQQRFQAVQPAAPQQDSTSTLLLKMAQPILEKKLQQEQEAQFVKGMQRVATGEAYKDIKGQDSFLSNIFGPSATVSGAAAMAKVKGVDDFQTKMYADMQGMASMSPEQFRDHAVGGMQQFLTGDADVDNVVQAKMVESLGPLMKAQTKANYAWTQQQTEIQYNGMIQSAGDKFHAQASQHAQGLLNSDDFELAKGQLLLASQPVAGMNPETYKKSIINSATLAMTKGNMWVDRVFRETGMYDALPAEDQTKLEASRVAAEAKIKNEYGFNKYGSAVAEILGGAAGRSPKQTNEQIKSLNERYMAETGSDSGLISMKDSIGVNRAFYSRAYRNQDKMNELVFKAKLDAQADGQLAQQADELAFKGAGQFAIDMGVPKGKFDLAVSNKITAGLAANNVDGALNVVIDNYTHGNGYTNPQFKSMLTEPLRQITQGQMPGPEFDRTIQFLDKLGTMPNSGGTVSAYLGAEGEVQLQRYRNALVNFKGDKLQAAQAAWGTPIVKGPKLDAVEMKPTMLEAVSEKFDGKGMLNSIDRWFRGANAMTPGSQDVIFQAVQADAKTYIDNLGMEPKAAFKKAMDGNSGRLFDRAGQFAYTKTADQAPLGALIGADDMSVNLTFAPFLQKLARDKGVLVNVPGGKDTKGRADFFDKNTDLTNWFGGGDSDVSITRHADAKDADGKTFGVFSAIMQRNGESAVVTFTSKDYKAQYEQLLKQRNDITETLRKAGL
jgi:hypothetical protein